MAVHIHFVAAWCLGPQPIKPGLAHCALISSAREVQEAAALRKAT